MTNGILDNDHLLNALEHKAIQEALGNPKERDRILLTAVVALNKKMKEVQEEAVQANLYCHDTCQPKADKRFRLLEKFKNRVLGIGAAIVFLVSLAALLWGIFG